MAVEAPQNEARILPAAGAPEVRLAPGEHVETFRLPNEALSLSARLPQASRLLDDPLDAAERRTHLLERASSPGPARAAAWTEVARIWQLHYGSLEEAARAYREAAAADPEDVSALAEATSLCAAMGDFRLAKAYADACVAAAKEPRARARAFRRLARVNACAGDRTASLEALIAAGAIPEADPEIVELVAHALVAQGDLAAAARHARLAAHRWRGAQRDRTRALLALASTLRPEDESLAYEYAEVLAEDGFGEAAIASLSEAAQNARDLDERRRLRLEAAERAERLGRPDLAAEQLIAAFESEPHVDVLYEPLVMDLSAAGTLSERAVWMEIIASACAPEQRASWLFRAAEAHLDSPRGAEWCIELLVRALEDNPSDTRGLAHIREQANRLRDPALFADTIERLLRRGLAFDPELEKQLIRELAEICEHRLGSPERACWAWEMLAGIDPSDEEVEAHVTRLRPSVSVQESVIGMVDRQPVAQQSVGTARRLATLLRDNAYRRERAIDLYKEAVEKESNDSTAASALDRLLYIVGDDDGRLAHLAMRAQASTNRSEQLRLFGLLVGFTSLNDDLERCARACVSLLELAPEHRETITRLSWIARKLERPDLERFALEREITSAASRRERAHALARLATRLEADGAVEDARRRAQEAIDLDPRAVEAVTLLLRHLAELPLPAALEVTRIARASIDTSAPLLELAETIASRAGRNDLRGEMLEAWSSLSPMDRTVARRRLLFAIEHGSSRYLISSIEAALAWEMFDSHGADLVRPALERLAALGATEEASTLALHAVDRLAHAEPGLLDVAEQLTDAVGQADKRVAALERRLARAGGASRLGLLRKLAALYHMVRQPSGEARAWLRVLARAPYDSEALAALTRLYAEAGETERLVAVLSVRVSAATEAADRRDRLLELAAAMERAGESAERVIELLKKLLAEQPADDIAVFGAARGLCDIGRTDLAVEELMRLARNEADRTRARTLVETAVTFALHLARDPALAEQAAVEGLCIAPDSAALITTFERLALERADIASAHRVYKRLIDSAMGRHGRRAWYYRMGRWLERAGELEAAFEAYTLAFDELPGGGASFSAVERLSAALERPGPLIHACLVLAERMPHPEASVSLLRRAARLCELKADNPERAFSILILGSGWRGDARLQEEVTTDLRRLARTLHQREEALGASAIAALLDALREQAEQAEWDPDKRMRILRTLADVHANERGTVQQAVGVIDEALAIPDASDVSEELRVELMCDAAEWLLADKRTREDAKAHLADAAALLPEHPRVVRIKAALESMDGSSGESETSTQDRRAQPAAVPPHERTAGGGSQLERALRDSIDRGDLDATEELGRLLASVPTRANEAEHLLLAVTRRDPARIEALRALHACAKARGATTLSGTIEAILSIFDPQMPAPDERRLAQCGSYLDAPSSAVHQLIDAALTAVLRLVWEGAANLFRSPGGNYGSRVSPLLPNALARIYADALRLLEPGDVALFLREPQEGEMAIVATQPPSILLHPRLVDCNEPLLRSRVGRALELGRTDHVLIATRTTEEVDLLIKAILGAFGRPDVPTSTNRDVAALSGDLFQTVPPRVQARMRELLMQQTVTLDGARARAAVFSAAARAALLVSGSVRAAADALLSDEPTLRGVHVDSETSFVAACRASPPLTELLRFALSDAYLVARARAESS